MADVSRDPTKLKDVSGAGVEDVRPLAGRRILLVGIGFYDYETAIADEFRRLGAQVQVEDERPPALRNRLAPLRRKFWAVSDAEHARHLDQIIARAMSNGPFDYVVVIKGELLDAGFVGALRAAQPGARLISYQWDSMERYPELVARQALFDRVLTFDHADHERYPRFLLRPTFFRPEIVAAAKQPALTVPEVDFCFVGWLHHDRLSQVETLRRQIRDLGMTGFFYLFTGMRTALQQKFVGRGEDVYWRPLSFARYAEQIAASRIIIDLPHPRQSGLTMRALEAVGTGKKMVTTSRDVALYDFYSPEQFLIVNPEDPQIDPAFLASPVPPLPATLVDSYNLRAWALDILGVTVPPPFLRNR
jgi:hypothetical protein